MRQTSTLRKSRRRTRLASDSDDFGRPIAIRPPARRDRVAQPDHDRAALRHRRRLDVSSVGRTGTRGPTARSSFPISAVRSARTSRRMMRARPDLVLLYAIGRQSRRRRSARGRRHPNHVATEIDRSRRLLSRDARDRSRCRRHDARASIVVGQRARIDARVRVGNPSRCRIRRSSGRSPTARRWSSAAGAS